MDEQGHPTNLMEEVKALQAENTNLRAKLDDSLTAYVDKVKALELQIHELKERLAHEERQRAEISQHWVAATDTIKDMNRLNGEANRLLALYEKNELSAVGVIVKLEALFAEKPKCEECGGSGEIGLADGEISCPKCHPEDYAKKRNEEAPKRCHVQAALGSGNGSWIVGCSLQEGHPSPCEFRG